MRPAKPASPPVARPHAGTPGRLRVPDDVAEVIRGLHPQIKHKVRAALRTILSAPDTGKPLRDELAGLRSFRLGHLRIVYRHGTTTGVEVVAIGPRRRIYEDTLRRLKAQ